MEFVWVVRRRDLFNGEMGQGFIPKEESILGDIRERGFFMERRYAETDPDFKQIIPYVVFTADGEIFTTKRSKKIGESRLAQKYSIGIGGHINPEDRDGDGNCLERACHREIEEEVTLTGPWSVGPVGFINDDSNEVGSVHFGVVFHGRVKKNGIRVNETEHTAGEFYPPGDVFSLDPLESWSRMVLKRFNPVMQ